MPHAPIRTAAALAGALLVTACTPQSAASEPQMRTLAVDQVAGFWALSESGGGARCQLSLSNLIIEGVRPVLVERCAVPALAAARSWRATANGFEVLSVEGTVLMAFRRTGEDAFEEVGGRYRLTRAPIS
ncbi:AprI/Inh family metalloprotease inhibitor [Brevundimonas bacteroides]|uniref:AprI/Inh family metalloprotease inhibitor n=1 Tax=Brevundimonas bacteroides TaxID=74311 RepID=UPI0004981F77|nr:AprI/Inh family metalloprotease inhibitor [Brevundimonas bacteroides]